jgi:hypothetical protein
MRKITITNSFHGTEASFVPTPTKTPDIGSVSRAVQNRVSRALCGVSSCECGSSIQSYAGETWECHGYDYDTGDLLIRYI